VPRSFFLLVVLAALSFFSGLGRGAITDSDEAFYAEAAREMVESGDWLTPHYNYEPRFQKPALYYWLAAATYLVTGPNEMAARFWSACAGLGLVLVVAACGRRWCSDESGLLAGAITATNFGYFALARMALPDLPVTFFITLAIYAALVAALDRERHPRRWLLISAAAAALGFLTKGPIAIAIPALVVLPIVLIERRSMNLRAADLALAALLFSAIALPWYGAMWTRHGTAYVAEFFIGDNFERFATTRFNDPRPWWFYLPVLLGGLLPWTPLALVWFTPIKQFLLRQRDVGIVDLRLLLWVLLPLTFYTASVGKQPRYVLPVLPPVALLLASAIIERTRDWRTLDGGRFRPRPSPSASLGCALAGLVLVALSLLIYRAQILFPDVANSVTPGAAAIIAAMGVLTIIVSLTNLRVAPACVAVAAAITFAVLPYAVLASPTDAAVRHLAAMVTAARDGPYAIGTYHVFVRNLVFYTGQRQVDLINDDQLAEFVRQNERALVVLPQDDLERLRKERSLGLEALGNVRYFDDAAVRVGTLLQPNADEDIKTVVLARPVRSTPAGTPTSFRD